VFEALESEEVDGRAIMADFRSAIASLNESDRKILGDRFGLGLTAEDIAEARHVPVTSVQDRIDRAVERLHRKLGQQAGRDHEGPGARRAISNAHAQALTGNNYSG